MKIGFNEATAMRKSDLATDLLLTEKYGYDYIEIRLDMLKDYLKSHTIEELAGFFSKSKVKPYALNSIENINFCSEKEHSDVLELMEWACSIAQKINNPYIIIVPTIDEKVKKYSIKETEEDSIKMLNELADIGERYGVKLAFEPIGSHHCAVKSIAQCWDIVKKVDRDSVGIAVDAFNLYLYKALQDVDDLEMVDSEKLFVFHIDDSEKLPIEKLDHCNRLWPGDGVIPLDRLILALKQKGFDSIASVELFRPEYWELAPEEAIKTGKEKTASALNKFYNSTTTE
ncbi:MAG TPA: sugar phosphate isomerase/epimerase family protein [Clostridia bacterium]|nr:sugar phosphate isomerase/epimerase family protein [Clostridia bacterium]